MQLVHGGGLIYSQGSIKRLSIQYPLAQIHSGSILRPVISQRNVYLI